jgi:hypothetical protein
MADKKVSVKHLQIDKSQSTMLLVIAGAVVVVVFCLFATKALVSKGIYQRRALHARQQVAKTLKSNYDSANTLFSQYTVFANDTTNVLGGSSTGNGNLDGDNPRIILDSLPSKYDAPALATSVEKVLTGKNITIESIKVIDDPATNSDQPVASPKPMPITFSFSGTGTFFSSMQLMQDFERSIRPFDANSVEIEGTDNALRLTVGMTTYFQPAKSLDLTPTKVVK